ncbi:aspartate aminotransferase family protein [Streptomyces plumbiresistens]|uniref:Aspartate aminotransferase family protein n=1 Tax=Streptomyces plumbiresistens TaxID=511811 RepID=A0ABP7SML2_9ACTN
MSAPPAYTAEPPGDLAARRDRVLSASYRLFYSDPVHLVRGEGVWLYDADNRRYLDAYNNVPSVGHGNPRVVEAMTQQARRLNAHTRYLSDELVAYAERLLSFFDPSLDRVILTCTGSEANDLAYRMARVFTGGTGAIVTANAYHGVTGEIAAISPSLSLDIASSARAVPAPDPRLGDEAGAQFARDVRAAAEDLIASGHRPAMLLLDTVLSSDGIRPDPIGMFTPAVEAIRELGGLYVADEVQAGFGRLGAGMWGFDRHGLVPDLVTLGKPMGNGYPLAGIVTRAEIASIFGRRDRYFNTFGGTSVAAAVGSAVLDEIVENGLIASADAVGRQLRTRLRDLAARHPMVGEVRGAGLFVGVDIVDGNGALDRQRAAAVVDGLRESGVLISAAGPEGATLKIRPPLVFGTEHAELLLDHLGPVLTALEHGCDADSGHR